MMVKRCIREDLLKKESLVTSSSFYAKSVALIFTYLFFSPVFYHLQLDNEPRELHIK